MTTNVQLYYKIHSIYFIILIKVDKEKRNIFSMMFFKHIAFKCKYNVT